MATTGHDSGLHSSLPSRAGTPAPPVSNPARSTAASETAAKPAPTIWLNGEVLACACPECHALMSIRAWLMVGDCSRCGTSIELSEEQEREVERLLKQQAPPPKPAPQKAATPSMPAAPSAPPPARRPDGPPLAKRAQPDRPPEKATTPEPVVRRPDASPPAVRPKPRPVQSRALPPALPAVPRPAEAPAGRVPAALRPIGAEARVKKVATLGAARAWLHDLLHDLPAWLVSLIFHLVLIILLGLMEQTDKVTEESITLSATLGPKDRAGERGMKDPRRDEVEFEHPGEPPKKSNAKGEAQAKQDAQELYVPRDKPDPTLPKLAAVLESLDAPSKERMFQGRDPRIRATVVDREGGTTYTEAAVTRGLRWISKHQNDDGSWSLHDFHHAGECDGRCDGRGQDSDTAGTALAILPFLGAGQTHLQGRYTDQVSQGLRWLLETQRSNGDLRGRGRGAMYAHGQATIVLCEAYALTGDEQLREPAQRAVDFIVDAQHRAGGWRYSPGEPGDTSVVGWQLMALRSAKMALLDVPDNTLARAAGFLDQVQRDKRGGQYAYMPGHGPTHVMTAEALLCRQYLGWPADHAGLRSGVEYLVEDYLPTARRPNMYYWYYATQVMHHMGGSAWDEWNLAMRDTLVELQETEGHRAGSWPPLPGDQHGQVGGRLYMTALAVCTLEVYYRHLPIYRAIEVE